METKLVTKNVHLMQWAAVVQRRNESGLTVDEYCEQNSLSRNQYYYWLRKLREAAIEADPTTFAEIMPPKREVPKTESGQAEGFQTQMKIQKGDITLSVNETTPCHLIEMVLEVAADAQ